MTAREDVERILNDGHRIEEGANIKAEPDIVNLRLAVRELQQIVVRLADEVDALRG